MLRSVGVLNANSCSSMRRARKRPESGSTGARAARVAGAEQRLVVVEGRALVATLGHDFIVQLHNMDVRDAVVEGARTRCHEDDAARDRGEHAADLGGRAERAAAARLLRALEAMRRRQIVDDAGIAQRAPAAIAVGRHRCRGVLVASSTDQRRVAIHRPSDL